MEFVKLGDRNDSVTGSPVQSSSSVSNASVFNNCKVKFDIYLNGEFRQVSAVYLDWLCFFVLAVKM
jgi:hypothetical protein